MPLLKGFIRASPFVGVFTLATDQYALIPRHLMLKERKVIEEALQVQLIEAEIGETALLGALSVGNSEKLLVSGITTDEELKELKKTKLEVERLKGNSALGNLIAVNDFGLVLSDWLTEDERKKIIDFFDLPSLEINFEGNYLIGSSIVATNNGLVAHPMISDAQLKEVEKVLKVNGLRTTVNYGDRFVRNSLVANSFGALAGENSSGIELTKIDDAMDSFRKR